MSATWLRKQVTPWRTGAHHPQYRFDTQAIVLDDCTVVSGLTGSIDSSLCHGASRSSLLITKVASRLPRTGSTAAQFTSYSRYHTF